MQNKRGVSFNNLSTSSTISKKNEFLLKEKTFSLLLDILSAYHSELSQLIQQNPSRVAGRWKIRIKRKHFSAIQIDSHPNYSLFYSGSCTALKNLMLTDESALSGNYNFRLFPFRIKQQVEILHTYLIKMQTFLGTLDKHELRFCADEFENYFDYKKFKSLDNIELTAFLNYRKIVRIFAHCLLDKRDVSIKCFTISKYK